MPERDSGFKSFLQFDLICIVFLYLWCEPYYVCRFVMDCEVPKHPPIAFGHREAGESLAKPKTSDRSIDVFIMIGC